MKVALIQISDIHFRAIENKINRRKEVLINRLTFQLSKDETVIFLLTGDITQSGREVEFNEALKFFEDVRSELLKVKNELKIYFEIVPGNHDVDLTESDDMRQALIDIAVKKNGLLDRKALDNLFFYQSSFFSFDSKLRKSEKEEYIYKSNRYDFDDFSLGIDCLNTSILSSKNEKPESLFIVNFEDTKRKILAEKYDFRVLIFHHPLHWFNSTTRNDYVNFFNKNYDALFFGHEHNPDEFKRISIDSDITCNSAGAFNYTDTMDSYFIIHKFNLENKSVERQSFCWKENDYVKINDSTSQISFNDKGIRRLTLDNNFTEELNKLGIHILKKDLKSVFTYEELFTIPSFEQHRTLNEISNEDNEEMTFDQILNNSNTIIIGDLRSGKTTLLKKIFKHEYSQRRKPILLSGDDIKDHKDSFYEKVITTKIEEQYGKDQVDTYLNLRFENKTIIIDDLHKIKKFDEKFSELLEFIKGRFNRIIISMSFEEYSSLELENKNLTSFVCIRLKDFGRAERLKLYENWYNSYDEYSKESKLEYIETAEKTIDLILGNKLISSKPETIILFLYQIDNVSQADSDIYGKLYDFMIMKALKSLKMQDREVQIVLKFLYVIAFKMYTNKDKVITKETLKKIIEDFSKYYMNDLEFDETIQILESCNIFRRIDDESYEFEYICYYYYLVCKYFVELCDDSKLFIDEQINNLYLEESFNLLVFYCYVGDTKYLFSKLRMISDAMFEDQKVVDLKRKFNDSIEFDFKEIKTNIECDKTYEEIQQKKIEIVKKRDEFDRKVKTRNNENDNNKFLKLVRINRLLGIIINSYAGTLASEHLIPTIISVYSMNFRSLDLILNDSEKLSHVLYNKIKDIIDKDDSGKKVDEKELKDLVNSIIYEYYMTFTLCIINVTSYALGSSVYVDKYSNFKEKFLSDTNLELIQSCIKLVHLHKNSIQSAIHLSDKYFEDKDYHLIVFLRCFCNEYFNHRNIQSKSLKQKYKQSKICKKIAIKFIET